MNTSIEKTTRQVAAALTLLAPALCAQNISTFDNDPVAFAPPVGGLNQPTSLTMPAGSRVEVVEDMFGIPGRAIQAVDDDGDFVGAAWTFPELVTGVLRIEATTSISEFMPGYFLQLQHNAPVVARLSMNGFGGIVASGSVLATYTPGVPFRVRLDLDLDSQTFAATLDMELDGFGDNVTTTDLPFLPAAPTAISSLRVGMNEAGGGIPNQGAVFDNIYIGPPCIGATYCNPAVPNSSGLPGRICAVGSRYENENYLTLEAEDLPKNRFGYFLVGTLQGFTPNAGGSQGTLCLGGTIGRFAEQIQSTGETGRLHALVDLADIPQIGAVTAGNTLNFQAWFRDANPMSTSNFTDAVAIPYL